MKNGMMILGRFDEIEISQKIGILFILNKIYLKKDLNVGDFANKIGVPRRLISSVFGTLYGLRFKELTNMYRVEYAKNKIEEGFLNQETLEALGEVSGFNSRSTFFNVFKKEFGEYPAEYWRRCLMVA